MVDGGVVGGRLWTPHQEGVKAMRRAYADRARHLGDPAFNPSMPIARLTSKDYAASLRATWLRWATGCR